MIGGPNQPCKGNNPQFNDHVTTVISVPEGSVNINTLMKEEPKTLQVRRNDHADSAINAGTKGVNSPTQGMEEEEGRNPKTLEGINQEESPKKGRGNQSNQRYRNNSYLEKKYTKKASPSITVLVRYQGGKTESVEVKESDKISNMVKHVLNPNAAAHDFHVTSRNRVLNLNKTFKQLNIQHNQLIEIFSSLRGGSSLI